MKTLWMLQSADFAGAENEGSVVLGTTTDPNMRKLDRTFGKRSPGRGEDEAFLCSGSVHLMIGDGVRHDPRPEFFPVCMKRATLYTSGAEVKARVSQDEGWQFNPDLDEHFRGLGIPVPPGITVNPARAANWVRRQLPYGASEVRTDIYIGLFRCEPRTDGAGLDEEFPASDLALAG